MSDKSVLAAIMFTDIVGYTALMGDREDEAMALLETNRKMQKPLIGEYQGLLLKEIGDGMLISFSTATSALRCALAIQDAAQSHGDLQLRIGIHVGEVVFSEGDVFGDGVNIASRLEPISLPGGITVSESVHRNTKNKIDLIWEDLGEKELKNVEGPVKIYRYHPDHVQPTGQNQKRLPWRKYGPVGFTAILAAMAMYILFFPEPLKLFSSIDPQSPSLITNQSIAVLPFADMSPDGNQEYLGDGIAEEIINALTKIQDLKVIGRTSSFSFKGQGIGLREIGAKLDVGTILEGSVQKSNDQIRITVQLINAEDGSHIWSERYDRELDNIFRIQDDIATQIAEKFKLTLSLSKDAAPPTRNLEAYELYLKGLQWTGLGLAAVDSAAGYFQESLQIDPQFVEAYAELSYAHWQIGFYGLAERAKHYSLARKMALKAIDLDPNSYAGYNQLGLINLFVDWDWAASNEHFEKARANGLPLPNYLQASYQMWLYGANEQMIRQAKILIDKDPLSPGMQANLTRTCLYARRFEETIRYGKQFLESSPNNTSIMRHIGEAHFFSGNPELALPYFQKLVQKDTSYVPHDYIGTLMALGQQSEARTFFDQNRESIGPGKLAICYIHLGDLDKAFSSLEQAYLDGDTHVVS